jgi:hypothetical protein
MLGANRSRSALVQISDLRWFIKHKISYLDLHQVPAADSDNLQRHNVPTEPSDFSAILAPLHSR